MGDFNFGDRYAEAQLDRDSAVIAHRDAPTQKIVSTITKDQTFSLVEFYYGAGADELIWFRDAYRETETIFSLVNNLHESRLLAAIILEALVAKGDTRTILSLHAGGFCDTRTPEVAPWLVALTHETLMSRAVDERAYRDVVGKVSTGQAGKAQAEETPIPTDWQTVAEAQAKLRSDNADALKTIVGQVNAAINAAGRTIRHLHEEAQILWWLFGEHSRTFNEPFDSYRADRLAVIGGVELGDLTNASQLGPVAAPVMLDRVLRYAAPAPAETRAISEIVDALSEDEIAALLKDRSNARPRIASMLTALQLAAGSGAGHWYKAFETQTGLPVATQLSPRKIAAQLFYETLLGRLT